MKKVIIFILCIVVMITSTGCWDKKIYENIGFILQIGIELDGNDKVRMSYLIPVVEPTAKEPSELVYDDSNLLREFREKCRRTTNALIEGGKIQQVVISDTLAYRGINNLLEVMERESSNPPIAFVVIAEGSVIGMTEAAKQFTDKPPRPAIYLHNLIENNMKSSYIPETRVANFITESFSPGIDPVAPIVKLRLEGGGGIEVTGTALFVEDKMVGKIDTEKTPLLLAMMGKMKNTVLVSRNIVQKDSKTGKNYIAISLNKVKRKLSVKIIDNKPVVDINLNFNGGISEYKWNYKYNEEIQKSIENTVAAEIKQNCEWILKYTKEVGSDPIGIGDIVRAKHNKYWEKVRWEDCYKDVIFNVKVKLKIGNRGITQ